MVRVGEAETRDAGGKIAREKSQTTDAGLMQKATCRFAREYRQTWAFRVDCLTATIFTEIAENREILPKRLKTLQNRETA